MLTKANYNFCIFSTRSIKFFWGLSIALLFTFFHLNHASAQENSLSRISAVERADSKGYVVRYHFSETVDSFRVHQGQSDLVQLALYGDEIDTTEVNRAQQTEIYDEISLHKIPSGIGVDMHLSDGALFEARAYRDGSSEDILLGLGQATDDDLQKLTADREPLVWSQFDPDADDMIVSKDDTLDTLRQIDEEYSQAKNRMRFDTVVIDPGHGGKDVGAIGHRGIYEKDIVLDIAKRLGDIIENHEDTQDLKVVFTRDDDQFLELEERGALANQEDGDLFISIHANKFATPQPHGTEIYFLGMERSGSNASRVMQRENNPLNEEDYNPDDDLSPEEVLAYELQNSVYMSTSEQIASMMDQQFKNRAQRRSRGVKQGRFVVLYEASMPGILVETGFISNPSEQQFLNSDWGKDIIASAIFRAIRDYKQDYNEQENFTSN